MKKNEKHEKIRQNGSKLSKNQNAQSALSSTHFPVSRAVTHMACLKYVGTHL